MIRCMLLWCVWRAAVRAFQALRKTMQRCSPMECLRVAISCTHSPESTARIAAFACSLCLVALALVSCREYPSFSCANRRTCQPWPPSRRLSQFDASSARSRTGRVLLGRASHKRRSKRSRGLSKFAVALALVMDSGCTWHVHPIETDLVNIRRCRDTVEGIHRKVHVCSSMGDLPIGAQDADGTWRQLLVRNVRGAPTILDSLLSVDQFWNESRTDVVFRDIRSVITPGEPTNSRRFPFLLEGGLNVWHVLGNAADPARPFEQARQYGPRR